MFVGKRMCTDDESEKDISESAVDKSEFEEKQRYVPVV